MTDYVRGGSLGFAALLLAGHTHPAIIFGFLVVSAINLSVSTSYFIRYMINK